MRISTAIVSTLVAAGSLSGSLQYAVGQQVSTPTLALDSLPVQTDQSTAVEDSSPAETASPAPPAEDRPAPDITATPTQEQATATPVPTETAGTPKATATTDQTPATTEPEPTPAPAEPVVITAKSDVIEYKYGVVQISLTKTDGAITDVTLLQGDASYGRDAAYAALIDATIQTQGINYGNYSGATFTTEAFKKAVTSALGKL